MSKALLVNACVRPDSRTLDLAQFVMDKLSINAKEVNLYNTPMAPLNLESMEFRDKAGKSGDFSDEYFGLANDFAAADTIVIAAPYWDLLFPSVLKTYLENVSVTGLTFKYSPQGRPIGLCNAKDVYYITTAGGYIGENNYGFKYVEALCKNLFGIENVHCIYAQGLDIDPDKANEILQNTKASLKF